MTLFMLALALAQPPFAIVREPRPPSRWELSTRADCGRTSLLFSDYGAAVHTGATPKVTINGRALRGPGMAQLITDLSTVTGVYRFSVQCERNGDITLRIFEGASQLGGGAVRYRAALARIKMGRLNLYTGLQPADAENFWFN